MNKVNRSYEIDILNYFDEKNLRQYKEHLRKLFIILPDNSLVSIYKKIKKNSNKPSFAEHIVTDYFIKYDIPYFLKTKSETRKKENKENIKKRVKKYRANTKKVNFQVMISLELKNKIKKYCFDNGCTYEQMLLEKLYL